MAQTEPLVQDVGELGLIATSLRLDLAGGRTLTLVAG